ncbi:MAG TPA: DsbA family protein [Sphingomicrobium sp.]|nr:DsbA family protein [Sphingomicrobium sp.]
MKVTKPVVAVAMFVAFAAPLGFVRAAPRPSESASIEEQRRWFTEDDVAPAVKPASYDVTIVEYMDYQCPYCRATVEPLKQLIAKDKKVRVIFRDWPVFGPASEAAAVAAIASKYQGKYFAMHDALMETPLPLNPEKIKAAAKKSGVDWDRLQKDMTAHSEEIEDLFQRNDEQAQMMGLEGTPGFIIGNAQSFGGMTLKQLETSVANARKTAREAGTGTGK